MNRYCIGSALSVTALLASLAGAQPVSTPLGTVAAPGTSTSVTISPGTVVWYDFTLASAVDASNFLDLVTSGGVSLDTEIGLYDAAGNLLDSDDDDGPGVFSALSYGATCPTRPNGDGVAFNGRDGATLDAGVTYYLAVVGFNADFGAAAWNVTTTTTLSGTVTLSLNLGNAATTPPTVTGNTVSVAQGEPVRVTATLPNCPAVLVGASVSGDFSTIGGGSSVALFNDGTNGDLVANDNVWSISFVVPGATAPGPYSVALTATNPAGAGNGTSTITVTTPPATLSAVAGVYTEVEDNDNKARANRILSMISGQSIAGTTTGTSTVTAGLASSDNFRVQTQNAPLGIYRHQLAITTDGAVGHVGTIRGLNQTTGGVGTTDTTFQTSSSLTTPARMVQWYGFGKNEAIFYRVTGVAATTGNYSATLTTAPITPVTLGTFLPGNILISTVAQGHTTDTDLWIYDSNLNAIADAGNDDESIAGGGTGTLLQSLLTRNYAPGTYYIALSSFNMANNLPSPSDDDFRTAAVLDFANALAQSSTATVANMAFSMTDSSGLPVQYPASKPNAFDIYFGSFTVAAPVTCGTADFDGDGDSGTDADIEAFFACLAGTCCDTCFGADFDGDGDTGTDADIEAFFRVLAGQPC